MRVVIHKEGLRWKLLRFFIEIVKNKSEGSSLFLVMKKKKKVILKLEENGR